MNAFIKSVLFTIPAFALGATAFARSKQPEMNHAIVQLEEAKHARHPVEHLEKAKHDLEHASHNKHGERVEALHQVTEAIHAAERHNHKAMEEHIEAAIHEVREGERAARR